MTTCITGRSAGQHFMSFDLCSIFHFPFSISNMAFFPILLSNILASFVQPQPILLTGIFRGKLLSYLLTGVTATSDNGHTAHFHDCSKASQSVFFPDDNAASNGEQSNVHFIVKVPVSGSEVDGVSCRGASVVST